jgi:hypothetical protein
MGRWVANSSGFVLNLIRLLDRGDGFDHLFASDRHPRWLDSTGSLPLDRDWGWSGASFACLRRRLASQNVASQYRQRGFSGGFIGGMPDPWTQAPSPLQLSSLCQEAASLARRLGWGAEEITLQRVMTHAEGAANRDGCTLHDNFGPVSWG